MAKRKRVILSWIPTDKNRYRLQNMGILNKHGRSAGRINLNDWLNRVVDEKLDIGNSSGNLDLEKKVILSEMRAIQKTREERDREDELKLRDLAQRLDQINNQKKVSDYDENKENQN